MSVADEAADSSDIPAWPDLPLAVQASVIDVAARILGAVDIAQVPAALARVARFTPAKRARAGAAPLARALADDDGFRALIGSALPASFGADSADPVRIAARAYLLRTPNLVAAVRRVAETDEMDALRERVAELTATVAELTTTSVSAESGKPTVTSHATARDEVQRSHAEVVKLRKRLREQGTRLRAARDEADRRIALAAQERDAAVAELNRLRGEVERWRVRAEQESHHAANLEQQAEADLRRGVRERAVADRRLELLLDTLADAAAGLRRELRLTPGGADPVDVVAQRWRASGNLSDQRVVDAARLREWLLLPEAHLVIDGYNVTKTGYPDLDLAVQRDRITRSLMVLAAETGCEVTVVFDGAAVVVPSPSTTRVRVLFSPPGVIADDVIRDIVRGEPAGRAVIVVTADREIIGDVRPNGARVAPPKVLLDVLDSS